MASTLSSKKRIRQNERRRARNRWRIRTLRTALKALEDKLVHGSYDEAIPVFRAACQSLDKTAGKGVIHKNTASRKKSRLSARMKAKKASGAKA